MDEAEVARTLATIEEESLEGVARFAHRAKARDELLLAAEWLRHARGAAALREPVARGLAALADADARTFAELRDGLRSGALSRAGLRALADANTSYVRGSVAPHVAVEPLDALVDGVLALPPIRETGIAPGPELIHYEPAPLSVVLALVDALARPHVNALARPLDGALALSDEDVVCDVGSGAGRIPLFFHLLTGARTLGIEIDPALSRIAEEARASLALDRVRFVTEDARKARFEDASVFLLVTPVKGRVLDEVLVRIRDSRAGGPLDLFTFGPGTPWVAKTPWLSLASGDAEDEFRLARFGLR